MTATPERRWLRFSLPTLFVVVAAATVPMWCVHFFG